jgi:hypothetical protein
VTNGFGGHLYALVTAVNNAGVESAPSGMTDIALVSPASIPVASLRSPTLLSWSSASGQVYQVWSTTNLAVPFAAFSGMLTAAAPSVAFVCNPTNAVRYYRIKMFP